MEVFGYKEKELQYYVLGNIIVMIATSKIFQFLINDAGQNEILAYVFKLLFGSSIIGSIIYVYTFLICSLIDGDAKLRLAYLKIGDLPGSVIFSEIKDDLKDVRIDKQKALEKYADVYEHMPDKIEEKRMYENNRWYDIYHKYRDTSIIKASQREFLAFRDMTIMTIPIIAGYLVMAALGFVKCFWCIPVFFILEFVATNVAMRMKGKRFVRNVIALDLRDK